MKSKVLFLPLLLCVSIYVNAQNGPANVPQWLHDAVFYQVYPSSYKDSDGDGFGDLEGVISKLDYIKSLGVDVIWFSPLFHSAWKDGGYDIIDFYKVDPRFGTNTDMVRLVEEAHKRGLKVCLDLVAGHTSDKCEWFLQSRQADKNQRYSDYYIWKDELTDSETEKLEKMYATEDPSQSTIGKWAISGAPRAKYYNKNFYLGQPSLNYGFANPDPEQPWQQSVDAPGPKAVRQELKNILSFWFGKGVDGFRCDMARTLVKQDKGWVETMKLWQDVRAWMDKEWPECVLISEWGKPQYAIKGGFHIDMNLINSFKQYSRWLYLDRSHQAYGGCYFSLNGGKEAVTDLYGNEIPTEKRSGTDAGKQLERFLDGYSKALEATDSLGYIAFITDNHDNFRINNGPRNTPDQLKVFLTFVFTMPGTPILYYGDELGMRSLAGIPNRDGANHDGRERSAARTPMQWTGGPTAGFSTCAPEQMYLPVCQEWTPANNYEDYLKWKSEGMKRPMYKGEISVEYEETDPESMLHFTRNLIRFRKAHPALGNDGGWKSLNDGTCPYPMSYMRYDSQTRYLVLLNPTGERIDYMVPDEIKGGLRPVFGSGKTDVRKRGGNSVVKMGPVSSAIMEIIPPMERN